MEVDEDGGRGSLWKREKNPSLLRERQAFSQESRSNYAKERTLMRWKRHMQEQDETSLDVYGVKINHPSGSPGCGIVFKDGDLKGRDCWRIYTPGTIMPPPLRITKNHGLDLTPFEREIEPDLVEISYQEIVRTYIRYYLDMKRQRHIALSQTKIDGDDLDESYVVKLKSFLDFVIQVRQRLPALTKKDLGLHKLNVSKKMRKWGVEWQEKVDIQVKKFSEFVKNLKVFEEPEDYLGDHRDFPSLISIEFEWRKRLYEEYMEYAKLVNELRRAKTGRNMIKAASKGVAAKIRWPPEIPESRRIDLIWELSDETILSRLKTIGHEPDHFHYRPFILRFLEKRTEVNENYKKAKKNYYSSRAYDLGSLVESIKSVLKIMRGNCWDVFRDPHLYARVYVILDYFARQASFPESSHFGWRTRSIKESRVDGVDLWVESFKVLRTVENVPIMTTKEEGREIDEFIFSDDTFPHAPESRDDQYLFKSWGKLYDELGLDSHRYTNYDGEDDMDLFIERLYWKIG